MTIFLFWIPGLMLGVEWDYVNSYVVVDLGIIRAALYYGEYDNEEEQA